MGDHLPYRFVTSSAWRTILKGAFGLNALLACGILYTLFVCRERTSTLGLVLTQFVVLGLTRILLNAQEGSIGTLSSDRVVIEPDLLLGLALPGPKDR